MSFFISRTACSNPTMIARATMLWPMFSSRHAGDGRDRPDVAVRQTVAGVQRQTGRPRPRLPASTSRASSATCVAASAARAYLPVCNSTASAFNSAAMSIAAGSGSRNRLTVTPDVLQAADGLGHVGPLPGQQQPPFGR